MTDHEMIIDLLNHAKMILDNNIEEMTYTEYNDIYNKVNNFRRELIIKEFDLQPK